MDERRNILRQLRRHHRLDACVACGKCSAACAMAAMYDDISLACSPRAFVQMALHAEEPRIPEEVRRCVQCGNCTATCPEGVDPSGLIRALLQLDGASEIRRCARCRRELPPPAALAWLENALPKAEPTGLEDAPPRSASAFLDLCPVCRRQAFAETICREAS
ncbi:MAG: 4Fe-4S dicluster domain-containing protein [Desulfovibrio sp.]|jgi:Fe-S oxidoreductase|nr:4Fe-4S dicluster domain-containing protein [Desulfovibrio sp.]